MKDDDFWVGLEPVEDASGGGYRTRHVILKRRHASLSQSVYSCRLHDKIAPNRDYSSEGLCSFIEGKSWKFIDAIPVGLKVDGVIEKLKPVSVNACLWELEYSYAAGKRGLKVSYYLFNVGQGGAGIVNAMAEGAGPEASIVFEPFFDIRPDKAPSDPGGMTGEFSGDTLEVTSGERAACVRCAGAKFRESPRTIDWRYKLGSGERANVEGHIRPVPEARTIASFYEIEAPGKKAELRFSCGNTKKSALELLDFHTSGAREDALLAQSMRKAIFPEYSGTSLEKGVVWRMLGMARFGMEFEGTRCMEAGGLLSRELLFRDQFAGLLNNFEAIKSIHGGTCMKNILLKAYELQDKWGLVPSRIAVEKKDDGCADTTLMAFVLAGRLVRKTNDGDLAVRSAGALKKFLDGVSACCLESDGPPMLKPNGLVSVSPHDEGRRNILGHMVTERINAAWAQELIEKGRGDELKLQKYLLPEVNALWIRCLESGWLFSKYIRDFKLADRCKMIYYKALEAYKPLFYNRDTGFINNLVTTDESALGRRIDPGVGSPGMVAAAILGLSMFTGRELESIAAATKERLLRVRWDMPIGVIGMEVAKSAYLNGTGERGGTVSQGDTPYLIGLLRMAGDAEMADRILETNLRHQMEEGFVFYNSSLFSCDHDMLPTGEPVCWLSQWVDPYLDYGKGR